MPKGFAGFPEDDPEGEKICHGGVTGGTNSWDRTVYLSGMDFKHFDDFAPDSPRGTLVWTRDRVIAELHKAVDYCLSHCS